MRWKIYNANIDVGTYRHAKKFAFWPVHIDGYWVWLEWYNVVYQWDKIIHRNSHIDESYAYFKNDWIEIDRSCE